MRSQLPATHRARWFVLPVIAALVLLLALPGPSAAICGRLTADPLIDRQSGDVVFVGTVAEVGSIPQNALFRVREVWYGDEVPRWLPVYGSDDGRAIWGNSTVFEAGHEYLVVARPVGSVAIDQPCSGTMEYTDSVRAMRPDDVGKPTPAHRPDRWGPDSSLSVSWVGLGFLGVVGLAAIAAIVLAFTRQRRFAGLGV